MCLITARTCTSAPVILLRMAFSGCSLQILMRPLRKNGQLHLQWKCKTENPACPGAGQSYRGRRRDPFCTLGMQGNHRSFQPDQKFSGKRRASNHGPGRDGCNPANSSDGQVSTRLQAYLEMLEKSREEKRS